MPGHGAIHTAPTAGRLQLAGGYIRFSVAPDRAAVPASPPPSIAAARPKMRAHPARAAASPAAASLALALVVTVGKAAATLAPPKMGPFPVTNLNFAAPALDATE